MTCNRRLSWAFYDVAHSCFTTLVVRFIYAMYFTKGIAANENLGTEQGAIAVTITAVIVRSWALLWTGRPWIQG